MPRRFLVSLSALIFCGSALAPALADEAAERSSTIGRIEQALEFARKKHNLDNEADALFDLGVAYIKRQEYDRAEDYIKQSLALEEKLNRAANIIQARQILASIYQSQHKFDEAAAVYGDALKAAEENKLPEKVVDVMLCQARLEIQRKDCAASEKILNTTLELAGARNDKLAQAQCLGNLSVIARTRNNTVQALDYLTRGTTILGDSNQQALGGLLMQAGAINADIGAFDAAVDNYNKAKVCFEEAGDIDRAGMALMSIAQNMLALQRPEEALKYAKEALERFPEDGNAQLRAQCLICIGSAEADLGDFSAAEQDHKQAADLSRSANYSKGELLALTETAYDQFLQGSEEKALNNFYQAYMFLMKSAPKEEYDKASLLGYTGMCYRALGQTAAAVKYQQDSAEIFSRLGKVSDEAIAYNSIAVAYLDSNDFANFEKYFNRAKVLLDGITSKQIKDKLSIAYLDYNYAQACVLQGKYKESLPSYEKALSTYREAHESKGEGRVLRGLGLAYYCLADNAKALEMYKQAKTLAEQSKNVEAQWDCAVGLGKAYKAMGNTKEAETNLRAAVQLVEQEHRQLSRDNFKTFNMDWRQDCFIELVDLLANSGRVDQSLEMVEKGRSRAFLDMLEGRRKGRLPNDAVAQVSTTPDEQTKDEEKPALVAMAIETSGEPGASVTRGVEVLPKARSLVEASAISPITANPVQLDELKNLVQKNNSTFLEYFVLPDKVLIYVVKPNGSVEMAPPVVISRRQLAEKVKAAYSLIVVPPKDMKELNQNEQKRQKALNELYHLLIQPVVSFLPKGQDEVVTVVPHGPLFSVPFAALLSDNGRYFVEDHTLAYVPAIGVLRATQKLEADLPQKKDNLLAFGNPITKAIAFLGTLPYAEREVKAVADLFGKDNANVEIGEKASKKAFRSLAPNYSVIHLATHGMINEERPMESALVLAPEGGDDGLLTVKDILQMPPLKARLCVLSACQTGRGKITGDGVVGLSRAFIIAGTPSIMVSQWNVDDVMTEYQMKELYSTYLANASKAKALREAQLKTIAFMEKTASASPTAAAVRANPRYWAAFQLIGEYQ